MKAKGKRFMNEMIQESLESYKSYAVNLPNGCQKIADYLREDAIVEAGTTIAQFSEGLSWLVDMNKLLYQHDLLPQLAESRIYEFLNEINNGLEIQDFVIVADMFEYEIKPFLQEHVESITKTN